MTELRIYREDGERLESSTSFDAISGILGQAGVALERWPLPAGELEPGAGQEQVLAACGEPVRRLMSRYGFRSVDVIGVQPDHPQRQALRLQFLQEHTHDDFEVRFFVGGQALFYIHAGGKVYALLCGPGDLIAVPAGAPHWFDMGPAPCFQCIRLFTTPAGWAARYTGDAIAERFPRLEQPHYALPQAAAVPA